MQITPLTLITVRDLGVTLNEISILSDISFELRMGEYVGVIGPNGGGKSTLIKVLLGLVTQTSGEVHIGNEQIPHPTIGYVPQRLVQNDVVFPATVSDVVASGLTRNIARKEKRHRIVAALEKTNCEHLIDRHMSGLSGGERQRVLVSRALLMNPHILILDEPTAGMDIASEQQFFALLKELHDEGMTILLVSHDIDRIAKEVDTVLCINHSMMCFSGTSHLDMTDAINKMYGGHVHVLHHDHHHH
jgi:zinc transport system ATP-binding protein